MTGPGLLNPQVRSYSLGLRRPRKQVDCSQCESKEYLIRRSSEVIHDDLAEQTQARELRLESEIGRQCQAEVTLLIAAEQGSILFGWSLPLQQVMAH